MMQETQVNKQKLDSPTRKGSWGTYSLSLHPAKMVVMGYLSYIIIGWLLLCLPFMQRETVSALDNLFTATSAVSTTGLVSLSTSDSYTFWGPAVILLLIQFGGIGYMTFGSFVILSRKANLSSLRTDVGQVVFSLPMSFRIDKFVRSVILFTVIIEMVGTVLLFPILSKNGSAHPLWDSIFLSVSAFCTAGFSLYNNSFEAYVGNFQLNVIISCLSYLGAIGFIVCVDFWRMLRGKSNRITLTSRIILWTTFWLTIGGTMLLFLTEPSIHSFSPEKRLIAAFFQTMTSLTTVGFNTIGIGGISRASLLIVIMLMVIGASPSGTGGGLKTTTVTAIFGIMKSAVFGEKEVRFWGRLVPLERIWTAVASLGFYVLFLMTGTFFLELTESFSFESTFFEAASALGTVGLSTGITGSLSVLGKLIIIVLMYCGRLGPLTFSIALFLKGSETDDKHEDLAI
jgi:trk system potassium uptake protein TrkH